MFYRDEHVWFPVACPAISRAVYRSKEASVAEFWLAFSLAGDSDFDVLVVK